MIWFAVIAVLVLLLILVVMQDRVTRKPVSPEAAAHAAVELHRIRRQLDVAQLKTEQRQGSSRLRQEIGDVLDGHGES